MDHIARVSGWAHFLYRTPDGRFGWERTLKNGVCLQGIDYLWETGVRGVAAGLLYGGLISNAGFLSVSSSDQHNSHPGWVEWTALAPATRPIWSTLPPNGGLLATLSPCHYVFTSDGQIRGAFLSTVPTVGSVGAGTLYNTVVGVSGYDVANGGTLDVSFASRMGD